jgi:hypothetical protein
LDWQGCSTLPGKKQIKAMLKYLPGSVGYIAEILDQVLLSKN